MSSKRFLDLQLSLLIEEFGDRAVAMAVSKALGLSLSGRPSKSKGLGSGGTEKRQKRDPNNEVTKELASADPVKVAPLKELLIRFEEGNFLPQTRDVERFLSDHLQAKTKVSSRSQSMPQVAKLLAELSPTALQRLAAKDDREGKSDLSIIADELLRRD